MNKDEIREAFDSIYKERMSKLVETIIDLQWSPFKAGYIAGAIAGAESRDAETEDLKLGYEQIKDLMAFWRDFENIDIRQMLEDIDDILAGITDNYIPEN